MKILAIETSCDETSVAIVENGRTILSSIIYSQIEIHKLYGGVVPEIASRNHLDKIAHVVDQAFEAAGLEFDQVDAIAVTEGPGLVGALLVGVNYAKTLSFALGKPLIPVNHIEGHISSVLLENKELEPPYMCLVVSGGHTHLAIAKSYTEFEVIGRTRDDAIGEAYDKVARTLGLPYPGGPYVDQLAKEGNREAIHFKRTFLEKDSYDFSFSGIKSGVLNYLNQAKQKNIEVVDADVAASFQEAVIEVLVTKAMDALADYEMDTLVVAGGVAANSRLREALSEAISKTDCRVYYPSLVLCTDNAAMIGASAFYHSKEHVGCDLALNATPNLRLGE